MIRSDGCSPPSLRSSSRSPRRYAGQASIALIGGRGALDRLGQRLLEADETARGRAFLGEVVELLLDVLDQGARLDLGIGTGGIGQVVADADQFASQGQLVDDLGVFDGRIAGDRAFHKDGEIGGATDLLEAVIAVELGLQYDGIGQRAAADQVGGGLIDATVDGVVEMGGFQPVGDPVIHLVVVQQRTQEGLFGLQIVRCRIGIGDVRVVLQERLQRGRHSECPQVSASAGEGRIITGPGVAWPLPTAASIRRFAAR